MTTRMRVGAGLLAASVMLLCLQFVLAFTTSILRTDSSISTLLLHLMPYTLLLVSLYLLFANSGLPVGESRVARGVIVLAASYSLAGAAFLLLLVAGLVGLGPEAVDDLFSHMPLVLVVGTVFALPFVNRFLQ